MSKNKPEIIDRIDSSEQQEEYEQTLDDYQLEELEKQEFIETQLELRKWEIEPNAKSIWADINKDSVLGNLEMSEMLSIRIGEDFYGALEALRSLQSHPSVADYFLPDQLLQSILRKKSSTLSLSNSKSGFLRRLLVSKFMFKGYDYPAQKDDLSFQPKPSKWNFLKKKKQDNMEV